MFLLFIHPEKRGENRRRNHDELMLLSLVMFTSLMSKAAFCVQLKNISFGVESGV